MRLYGEFDEKGYHVRAYLPDGAAEGIAFKVEILAGDKLLHDFRVPMIYEPRFGPDSGDVAKLEAVTDRVLEMLPKPDAFDEKTVVKIDAIVKEMA